MSSSTREVHYTSINLHFNRGALPLDQASSSSVQLLSEFHWKSRKRGKSRALTTWNNVGVMNVASLIAIGSVGARFSRGWGISESDTRTVNTGAEINEMVLT
jgi:hypothetical protein